MMTEANISRLVGKLSQMRGAALKVGQFLSIQGQPLGRDPRLALLNNEPTRYTCFAAGG